MWILFFFFSFLFEQIFSHQNGWVSSALDSSNLPSKKTAFHIIVGEFYFFIFQINNEFLWYLYFKYIYIQFIVFQFVFTYIILFNTHTFFVFCDKFDVFLHILFFFLNTFYNYLNLSIIIEMAREKSMLILYVLSSV